MFTHAAAGTECEVDGMNTVGVDYCERSATSFRVSARVLVVVSELHDVANVAEAAVLKKCARPFLKHVRLWGIFRQHETCLNPVKRVFIMGTGDATSTLEQPPKAINTTI